VIASVSIHEGGQGAPGGGRVRDERQVRAVDVDDLHRRARAPDLVGAGDAGGLLAASGWRSSSGG